MELIQDTLVRMALWGVGLGLAFVLVLLPAVLLVGWRKWVPVRAAAVVTLFVGLGFLSGWCVPEPRLGQECYQVIPLLADPLTLIPIAADLLVGFAVLWGAAALFREEGSLQRGASGLRHRLVAAFINLFISIAVPWTLGLLASIWYLGRLADASIL